MDLQNKTVIVTGASKGIGFSIVKRLIENGSSVCLVSRNNSLKKIYKSLNIEDHNNFFFIGDASSESFMDMVFRNVLNKNKKIHGIINNAGVVGIGTIDKISSSKWDYVINNNLKSSFICSKVATKYFKKQNFGNIINISSVAARNYSLIAGVHYTASKAGIIGLTRQLAFELSQYNIRVNCIAPSQTKTDTLMKSIKKKKITLKSLENKLPQKKLAMPEDTANACIFLLSDYSLYINGAVIDVNGGVI